MQLTIYMLKQMLTVICTYIPLQVLSDFFQVLLNAKAVLWLYSLLSHKHCIHKFIFIA